MKIINHCVIRKIGDAHDHYLLINTLNAFCLILSFEEMEVINKWRSNGIAINERNTVLYKTLQENACVVDDEEEENAYIEKLTQCCRNGHQQYRNAGNRVVFVLTYGCNFKCPYCYEKNNVNSITKILSEEQVDRILELNSGKIRCIDLFGGEPLLLTNRRIIEYIIKKAPDVEYVITTNGYYLSEYMSILKTVKIKYIMVTLDGSRETHNKTRCLKDNGTTYDKILNGITDCLKNGIPIRIRMNVSENNLEECLKGRMKLKEQYKEFFDRNLLSFELQPLFQLDATIKQKITTQVLYNFDRSTEKINQMNTLFYSSFPLSRRLLNKNYKFTPRYCNCDAEESKRFYDPEGNIYSCVLALGKENTKIGTYYPQVISKSISMLDRNIETIPKCKECLFRFLCGGGCANESIDASGNPLHPSCRYMEQQLLEVTDFIKEKLDEEMSYCC